MWVHASAIRRADSELPGQPMGALETGPKSRNRYDHSEASSLPWPICLKRFGSAKPLGNLIGLGDRQLSNGTELGPPTGQRASNVKMYVAYRLPRRNSVVLPHCYACLGMRSINQGSGFTNLNGNCGSFGVG